MIAYKLTRQNMTTHAGFKWVLGERYDIKAAREPKLCTSTVFHGYETALLAAMMNPIHAGIDNPRIFEAECEPVVRDSTKLGSTWMRLVREIDLPRPSAEQRVAFGILAACEVCLTPQWRQWAKNWLNGIDRRLQTANAAAYYAAIAAIADADAADADAAACAGRAAAGAGRAGYKAHYASHYAARAAVAAHHAALVDLAYIAQRAFEYDWWVQ